MKPWPVACAALLFFGCSSPKPEASAASKAPAASKDVRALQADYESAKAAHGKAPEAKDEYVEATVAYATAVMKGDGPPKVKYPMALELYAEALKLDPKNEEAVKNRDMILGIYESMGRKPPGQK